MQNLPQFPSKNSENSRISTHLCDNFCDFGKITKNWGNSQFFPVKIVKNEKISDLNRDLTGIERKSAEITENDGPDLLKMNYFYQIYRFMPKILGFPPNFHKKSTTIRRNLFLAIKKMTFLCGNTSIAAKTTKNLVSGVFLCAEIGICFQCIDEISRFSFEFVVKGQILTDLAVWKGEICILIGILT